MTNVFAGCREDASYLVTGGLGVLGLEIAQWLAHQGARHLVLAGRSPLPPRSTWDALAEGTAEHDDVAHSEHLDGELDRRTGAVVAARAFARRHEVGDVPHEEDVARIAIEDDRGIDARIAARDHRDARPLAIARDAFEERPLIAKAPGPESLPTAHQFGNRHGCDLGSGVVPVHVPRAVPAGSSDGLATLPHSR